MPTHRFKKQFDIVGTMIGEGCRPYIIAELSANHNGSIETARATILAAKKNGANAIKLQTYTADTMTIDCDNDEFMIKGGLWDGYKLYDLYEWAHTPYDWHQELFDYAKEVGITIFSTPFDQTAIDLLESLHAPAYKIASFEIVDIPLIKAIAKTGKPIIMSTGMASEEEINDAVDIIKEAGCQELVVLHCISSYPAPIEQTNLMTMLDITNNYQVIGGLSDHTLGNIAAITASALGAKVIEKHFILSRDNHGPDSTFSIEPYELKELCSDVENAWQSLGVVTYQRSENEKKNIDFRRSLYFVNNLKSGTEISEADIRSIRPGKGIAPQYLDFIIGKKVIMDIECGTPVSFSVLCQEVEL